MLALCVDYLLCNMLLKPLTGRTGRLRPCNINQSVALLIPRPSDYSFPSGHTASSFAAVSALHFSRMHRLLLPCLLAAAIAFSRLYLYVHFPTDILAGMMLSVAAGWLGSAGAKRLPAI